MTDSTQRFSDRVENYIRYRPSYPLQVLEMLRADCGLTPASSIADIACGTGIFTRMLLENGNRVYRRGTEPRDARGGRAISGYVSEFTSVAGTAEATTLADHSVDSATAAQAAHWFDSPEGAEGIHSHLKPGGWAVLLWNERRTDTTPFLRDYEQLLLQYGTDYQEVRHEHTTDNIGSFFAPSPFE